MSDNNEMREFPLGKKNFMFMAAGMAMVIIGFFLMAGGGSEDPAVFSEELFSFRRITLAPVVILAGYGIVLYGIIKKL